MFKAIGRWGSHVRSSINLHIFSNIFGSKSKKYGDLDNEDEEIFIDAQEDIVHESDTEEDILPQKLTELKLESSDSKLDTADGKLEQANSDSIAEETDVTNEKIITQVDVVERNEANEDGVTEEIGINTEQSSRKEDEKEKSNSESSDDSSEAEHEDDDDDHHINHKDTKQMVKKQNNGIVHSASSSSMIQKVHRRMNSYSQRQYAKFDNFQDNENDNNIDSTEDSAEDTVDSSVISSKLDQAQDIKTEKKSKKRKKIAKRTRKAARGSWKWFKRSMTAYASTFNFSSIFIVNIASAAKK